MSFLAATRTIYAVDPEGNQLPYIDNINMDRAADLSIMDAKIVGGTYDFAAFQLRILFYATYAEGAPHSNAHMKLWESGKGGEVVYNVNMNWEDEEMREVFSDDRFRQALSLAINRRDINDVIYFGNASETQMTVIPVSRHYKPEYAEAYAEFDPDRANELLDEMGLEWNAAGTHRLWPQQAAHHHRLGPGRDRDAQGPHHRAGDRVLEGRRHRDPVAVGDPHPADAKDPGQRRADVPVARRRDGRHPVPAPSQVLCTAGR
jgi:ABC-type transport system substrate-binding protein